MNLYDDSALNSWEVAVRFHKDADEAAYAEVAARLKELGKKCSEEAKVLRMEREKATNESVVAAAIAQIVPALARQAARVPTGHCIRCGASTRFDTDRPLCGGCFREWARYKNPDFAERFCHSCGKERKTSVGKPLCRACWENGA
jgi:hypothetical protein